MTKFMVGKKVGMTQLFTESGQAIPSTVIDCGPLIVVQNKSEAVDGYKAVKVGYGFVKEGRVTRPVKGQYEKIEAAPRAVLREFKTSDEYETGQEITVSDMFQAGDRVDISGVSKGKGFAGNIKRHGYSRGPQTHGSKYHRRVGSMGAAAYPARVFKGKKLPGQMGNKNVTVQNLEVVMADGERSILVVKGAVPGPKGGLVEIKSTVKTR